MINLMQALIFFVPQFSIHGVLPTEHKTTSADKFHTRKSCQNRCFAYIAGQSACLLAIARHDITTSKNAARKLPQTGFAESLLKAWKATNNPQDSDLCGLCESPAKCDRCDDRPNQVCCWRHAGKYSQTGKYERDDCSKDA